MKTSDKGLRFLEILEAKKNKIYKDIAGLDTIGVGHLLLPGEYEKFKNGISDETIRTLLESDIIPRENAVNVWVKIPMSQEKFDALVIFVFNIGIPAFKFSTVLKLINEKRPISEIEYWWKAWNKAVINGVKQVSNGLVNRRNSEWNLFLTEIYHAEVE